MAGRSSQLGQAKALGATQLSQPGSLWGSQSWQSYSVKFLRPPLDECTISSLTPLWGSQSWQGYSVKFHPLLSVQFLLSPFVRFCSKIQLLVCMTKISLCGPPTNMKLNLLQSDSDWSKLQLHICWCGLQGIFSVCFLRGQCAQCVFSEVSAFRVFSQRPVVSLPWIS